ncbi:MAG: hypothetical protein ACM3UZ_14815 [Acidobacteriota bacterium]
MSNKSNKNKYKNVPKPEDIEKRSGSWIGIVIALFFVFIVFVGGNSNASIGFGRFWVDCIMLTVLGVGIGFFVFISPNKEYGKYGEWFYSILGLFWMILFIVIAKDYWLDIPHLAKHDYVHIAGPAKNVQIKFGGRGSTKYTHFVIDGRAFSIMEHSYKIKEGEHYKIDYLPHTEHIMSIAVQ